MLVGLRCVGGVLVLPVQALLDAENALHRSCSERIRFALHILTLHHRPAQPMHRSNNTHVPSLALAIAMYGIYREFF